MLVTDITPTKRGRYSVFIEGEFAGVLHSDIYLTCSIQAGQEISSQELGNLMLESQKILAKERAFKLLAARSYTAKGLYDKLIAKDIPQEIAEQTVYRMEELCFIDDADYARRYGSDCIHLKGYSPYKTLQELKRKGIEEEIARQAIEELEHPEEEELVAQMITKKFMAYLDEEKGRAKTVNAMLRKGYRYEIIARVIKNLREDTDYYVTTEH